MNNGEDEKLGGIRFSPTIELGHLIQVVFVVGSIAGWALWGYAAIESQIGREDSAIALLQQRLDSDEKAVALDREVVRAFNSDMRGAVSHISDQIADLRALIAASNPAAASSHR